MSRGGRTSPNAQQPSANVNAAPTQSASHQSNGKAKNETHMPPSLRYGFLALLFSLAILLAAMGIYISTSNTGRNITSQEAALVDTTKFQAVFLNGGQVYFGKIKQLNSKFLAIEDIYYLRVNQQIQPDGTTKTDNQNISLAKLGSELHGPDDRMVINQDQILFWENLKKDGQVVKAIDDYKKNGEKTPSNDAQGTTNTNPTPTTTPTTPPATPPASADEDE